MITIEDVNGSIYRDGVESYFHMIDTSLISDDSDFTNVVYDFVKVSRSTSGSNITYSFEVSNEYWNGQCYATTSDGTYLNVTISRNSSTGVVSLTTTEDSIKFYLYITSLNSTFLFKKIYVVPRYITYSGQVKDISYLKLEEFGKTYRVIYRSLLNDSSPYDDFLVSSPGVYTITYSGSTNFYYIVRLLKTDFSFECTQDLICGQVNTVSLGAGTKYKPGGALVGNYTPNIIVNYNGNVIPVTYDEDIGDYVFDLDLSNINNPGKVKFTVQVEGNKVVNNTETLVRLDVDVHTISTFNELRVACDTDGPAIIKLSSNLTGLTSDIPVKHSIKIIGNNKSIGLNEHSIILNDNVSLIVEDCTFNIGNPAIIQGKNTTLDLTGCSFTGCSSDDYNNLGSCIYCDVDIDSLTVPDDFTTILNECSFTDNKGTSILHGGALSIKNSIFINTDYTCYMKEDSNFLYLTDGEANITNTSFKLYLPTDDEDYYCTNTENIGYSQCLFTLGTNATLNGQTHQQLQDNTPNLCESPYNNRANIFLKYYYPSIETCVYTSPTIGDEDKSYCYALSGINWVYKVNAQVTRADAGTENRTNPTF